MEARNTQLDVRPARQEDHDAVWAIFEPIVRDGETFALERTLSREDGIAYWFAHSHRVYVAEAEGQIVGSYFLQPNQRGGGAHVANCGYITAPWARNKGIASALCAHSIEEARRAGFLHMQFNFVVSTNTVALAVWKKFGFAVVGRLPEAFSCPRGELVDVFIMHRRL